MHKYILRPAWAIANKEKCMNNTTVFIVILCTFILYVVLCVSNLCSNKNNYVRLEKAAKKALHLTLGGLMVLGLALLLLSQFEMFSKFGYKVLPGHVIDEIRELMRAVLKTNSVRKAIVILIAATLFAVEFCLVFSCVGLFVTKAICLLRKYVTDCLCKVEVPATGAEVAMPHRVRRIFLQFARIRI